MALISFQVWEASRLLVRSFILSLQQLLSVILLRVTVHLTPSLRRKLSSVQLKITEVCLPSYFSNKNYISWHDSLVHPPTPQGFLIHMCLFPYLSLSHRIWETPARKRPRLPETTHFDCCIKAVYSKQGTHSF